MTQRRDFLLRLQDITTTRHRTYNAVGQAGFRTGGCLSFKNLHGLMGMDHRFSQGNEVATASAKFSSGMAVYCFSVAFSGFRLQVSLIIMAQRGMADMFCTDVLAHRANLFLEAILRAGRIVDHFAGNIIVRCLLQPLLTTGIGAAIVVAFRIPLPGIHIPGMTQRRRVTICITVGTHRTGMGGIALGCAGGRCYRFHITVSLGCNDLLAAHLTVDSLRTCGRTSGNMARSRNWLLLTIVTLRAVNPFATRFCAGGFLQHILTVGVVLDQGAMLSAVFPQAHMVMTAGIRVMVGSRPIVTQCRDLLIGAVIAILSAATQVIKPAVLFAGSRLTGMFLQIMA